MKKIKRILKSTISDSERKLHDDIKAMFSKEYSQQLSLSVRRALAEKRKKKSTT